MVVAPLLTVTLLDLSLSGCEVPRYRMVPPVGHNKEDISWDLAYCKQENRERLVMQGEQVEADACLQGRGWTAEPIE